MERFGIFGTFVPRYPVRSILAPNSPTYMSVWRIVGGYPGRGRSKLGLPDGDIPGSIPETLSGCYLLCRMETSYRRNFTVWKEKQSAISGCFVVKLWK